MSNFKAIARKKGEKEWREARMLDDYYGKHKYGVRFMNEPFELENVYREEECEFKNL
jgi:hypothetical protein